MADLGIFESAGTDATVNVAGQSVGGPDVALLRPANDVEAPEVSIVVPALNEQITVGEFVECCHQGLAKAGLRGEILIVDSSTDETAQIALDKGARVLRVPRRGLGRAYIDALPFVRGRYVVVGDADLTYDFRQLGAFVEKLREGYEFVMGSRFKGSIEAGAMPPHHRYFGSPLTTWLLNRFYGVKFSDIHCGMRALTLDALRRINLSSQGWEYASEMIIKAVRLRLRSTEVPIDFYRDREGRLSHVRRGGWLTPWVAGWHTLRILMVNAADYFMVRPGWVLAGAGGAGVALLTAGPRHIGGIELTLHAQMAFFTASIIGLFSLIVGLIARALYDPTPHTATRYKNRLPFNRMALLCGGAGLAGAVLDAVFVWVWVDQGYAISATQAWLSHLALTGLYVVTSAFALLMLTLMIHAIAGLKGEAAGR